MHSFATPVFCLLPFRSPHLRQLARLEFLVRHLWTVAPYITARKIYNLMLNVAELRLNVASPRSLPPYLKIEPTPLCQMACPGCAHGDRDLKKQLSAPRQQLRLVDFAKIVAPLYRTAFGVSLSLRGEPLLGQDLLPIIEYAHAKNLAVSFPTNLSIKLNPQKAARLVESGVDAIYVSLDGATKFSYDQYRLGGDFALVLRNLTALAEARERLQRSRPRLIWKFVVFEHNRHEIPLVRKHYRRLGFDGYELVEDYDSETSKDAQRIHNERLVSKRRGCFWAWHTITVRADGVVTPCCIGQHNFGLGNARTEDMRDIWRGEPYTRLRRGFSTMQRSDLHPICARCLEVAGARDELRLSPRNPATPSTLPLT
jgi:MoaA/NifB/PqqE/SkfB family radical SAM enzyme